jgi:hypothetical protein
MSKQIHIPSVAFGYHFRRWAVSGERKVLLFGVSLCPKDISSAVEVHGHYKLAIF